MVRNGSRSLKESHGVGLGIIIMTQYSLPGPAGLDLLSPAKSDQKTETIIEKVFGSKGRGCEQRKVTSGNISSKPG